MTRWLAWTYVGLAVVYAITAAIYFGEGRDGLGAVWTFSTLMMSAAATMGLAATRRR